MKFTQEELLEALKGKLTMNGKKLSISERTLSRQVERIHKRLEKQKNEEELSDVVSEYLPDFEEMDGNMRHDKSDFIKEYERLHPDLDATHRKKPDDDTNGDDDSVLARMQKQLQDLLDKQKADTVARNVAEKKSAIFAKLKGENVNDEKWIKTQLDIASITPDTDIDDLSEKVIGLYNQSHATTKPSRTPGAAGGKEPNLEHEFDDIAEAMKE